MRIGLLGGTFDPPHIGHLSVAVHARDALELDRVLLVVANRPWQKEGTRPISDPTHRLAMVGLAVEPYRGLEASSLEIDRGGVTYTIDTVEQLVAESAVAAPEVVLVVGADAAAGLDTWHRADELAAMVDVAVADRPGPERESSTTDRPLPRWRTSTFASPLLDVSSSGLRRRVLRGASLDVLTPPAVVDYIVDHDLYSGGTW